MAKKIDIIDVMIAVNKGYLKVDIFNGFYTLEDTRSGERVRLNVAPVVRCKECVHRVKGTWAKCIGRRPEEFCSDGERRFHV